MGQAKQHRKKQRDVYSLVEYTSTRFLKLVSFLITYAQRGSKMNGVFLMTVVCSTICNSDYWYK
jgi:hypothetical protein